MASHNQRQKRITRRNLVQSTIVGGSTLLAGCNTDGDGETNTEGGTDSGTGSDGDAGGDGENTRFVLGKNAERVNFGQMDFNVYNPNNFMGGIDPAGIMYDPLIFWFTSRDEWEPYISEWTLEDDVIELEFNEDWYWHDGDQVTARDYFTQSKLSYEMQRIQQGDDDPSDWVQKYELVDEFMMRIQLQDSFAETWALRNGVGTGLLIVKENLGEDRTYGDWLSELEDAEGDEGKQLISEFTKWEQPEPIGNGPFQVKESSPSGLTTELFEDHPYADQIAVDEYRFETAEDVVLAFQEEQVDGIMRDMPVPDDLQGQMPDHHPITREQVTQEMICMNHGNYDHPNSGAEAGAYEPYTSDREVRKAVAYILDRSTVQSVLPNNAKNVTWAPSWLSPTDVEQDVYDLSGFETYEQDRERAAKLLEQAGYSEDGDTWVDENGEPMSMRFMATSGGAIALPMGQATVDQLKDFGIPAELEAVDNATFGERRFAGEYDLMFDGSDATSTVMTWDSFAWTWLAGLHHGPNEYEVPMPVGDPGGSDGTETINIKDEIAQWARTGDKEHPRRCAWAWNQALPRYEINFRPNGGGIRSDKWDVSGPEAVLQNRPAEKNILKHPDASLQPK